MVRQLWPLLLFCGLVPLYAQDALSALKAAAGGMYSSFTANFTYTSSGGAVNSGKIYYQYPNKLHVRTSNGGVIATNGTHLWIYNPASAICARQDVGGSSGGIIGLLSGYEGQIRGNSYVFRKPGAYYEEVVVTVSNGMIASVRLRHEDETSVYSFSGIQLDAGIKGSLFTFKPPANAQLVENPLNR